jgi:heptaprenyl diphosphate synthase
MTALISKNKTSTSMQKTLRIEDEDWRIAQFAALAIAIHLLESAVPSPIPGVKPGLANVITMAVFVLYGFRAAAWVTVLRVLIGSIIAGTFLSPGFLLSASGGLLTLIMLGLIHFSIRDYISPVGIGVLCALSHMSGQFFAAYFVLVQHPNLFTLLPILMTAALFFGLLSGWLCLQLLKRIEIEH